METEIGDQRYNGVTCVNRGEGRCTIGCELSTVNLERSEVRHRLASITQCAHAKLCRMDSPRPLRVTLTGDVSGVYVVVEQRPDGSLVVAPDMSRRSETTPRRSASPVATLFSGLFTPPPKSPMTGAQVLEGWGVELDEGETIEEFFVADVDDRAGFLAITSQRFIFVADIGKGPALVHEHLLSAARNVEVVRRGLRYKLRVTWHGAESLVGGLDRKALVRLQDHLQDRGLP